MNKTLANLQMLRGIAAVLVVIHHLGQLPIKAHLGFGGVDIFFVLSGFLMTYISYGKLGQPRELPRFLWRRVSRIYPLWWVFLALCTIWIKIVVKKWPDGTLILQSVFLWKPEAYPVLFTGWSLIYEMLFYLVFAVFFLLPRRFFFPMLGLWAAATLAGSWHYDSLFGLATKEMMQASPALLFPLNLEFMMGCVLGWLHLERSSTTRVHPMVWVLLGIVIYVGGAFAYRHFLGLGPRGLWRVLSFGVAGVFLLHGLLDMERQRRYQAGPRWVFLGNISYSLYLSHYLVIRVALRLVKQPRMNEPYYYLWMFAVALACVGLAAFSYYSIEKPLLEWTRRLGRRSKEGDAADETVGAVSSGRRQSSPVQIAQ